MTKARNPATPATREPGPAPDPAGARAARFAVMAVDPALSGMTLPATEPYEITRVKVREFREAIGDPTGAGDGAPATFPIVVAFTALRQLMAHPLAGMSLHRVVHGDQRFVQSRPLRVGDVVTAALTVDAVRHVRGADILRTRSEIVTVEGEHICTAFATLVHQGEETAS